MQSHNVGNFMTHEDMFHFDLILEVKIWSIELLIGKGLNRHICRANQVVRCAYQRPISWSTTEYAPCTEEYAQHVDLRVFQSDEWVGPLYFGIPV